MVALDKYLETEGILIHIFLNLDVYLRLAWCRPQYQELYLLPKVYTAHKEIKKKHEWVTAATQHKEDKQSSTICTIPLYSQEYIRGGQALRFQDSLHFDRLREVIQT